VKTVCPSAWFYSRTAGRILIKCGMDVRNPMIHSGEKYYTTLIELCIVTTKLDRLIRMCLHLTNERMQQKDKTTCLKLMPMLLIILSGNYVKLNFNMLQSFNETSTSSSKLFLWARCIQNAKVEERHVETVSFGYGLNLILVRFQVLTATNMHKTVFWDVAPCSLVASSTVTFFLISYPY
jgi:hypothetical protein